MEENIVIDEDGASPSIIDDPFGEAFANDKLEEALVPFLLSRVPQVCQAKLDPNPDEEYVACADCIFSVFEKFLCEGLTVDQLNEQLGHTGNGSTVCGYIFKAREPTYSCRDCAMDPTCVLCRSCFVQSVHVKHNYKMHSSQGGGYCDCGDAEAWRSEPWCRTHKPVTTSDAPPSTLTPEAEVEQEAQRIADIPEGLRRRTDSLISLLLKWSSQLLLWEAEEEIPGPFVMSEADNYLTVLFNDEVHSYDQVIRALMKNNSCDNQGATGFATIVDRDGRSVIRIGNRELTNKIATTIREFTTRTTTCVLECRSIHADIVAFQNFAVRVVHWITDLVGRLEVIRPLVCAHFFRPSYKNMSFVEVMFADHTKLWKMARREVMTCFMGAILKDPYYKKWFAEVYVDNYRVIVSAYKNDDHYDIDSLKSLNCQIFTVMSLARVMLQKKNVLCTVIDCLLDEISNHLIPLHKDSLLHVLKYPQPPSTPRTKFDHFQRHFDCCACDLKYLLLSLRTESDQDWCTDEISRQNFFSYFTKLINLLSYIQDMNQFTRSPHRHVDTEPEWSSGFFIMSSLSKVIRLTVTLAATDIKKSIEIAKQIYLERLGYFDASRLTEFKFFGKSCQVVSTDISSDPVSVIQTLPRLLAALYHQALKHNYTWADLGFSQLELIVLLERPLQLMAFVSQASNNMWVRNGVAIQHVVLNLFRPLFRQGMVERDFELFQQIAAQLPPDDVILAMVNKLNLADYFQKKSGSVPESLRLKVNLAETLFRQLLHLVSERHRVHVGLDVDVDKVLEHELLHVLCIKPQSHSELVENLGDGSIDKLEVRLSRVLDSVATRLVQGQKTVFQVRSDLLPKFNRFFYHYRHQDRNTAEQWVRKQLKDANNDDCLPPPVPIEFTPLMAPIVGLLRCETFVHLLTSYLDLVITQPPIMWWSDMGLDLVLHLIGVALHEDERQSKIDGSFPYLELLDAMNVGSSSDNGLLARLEFASDNYKHVDQSHLLRWTRRRYYEVKRLRDGVTNPIDTQMEVDDEASMGGEVEQECNMKTAEQVQKDENEDRKQRQLAIKQRRERALAKISKCQQKFKDNYAGMIQTVAAPVDAPSKEEGAVGTEVLKVVGVGRSTRGPKQERLVCILCQEDVVEGSPGRALMMIGNAVRSTVLSHPALASTTPSPIPEDTDSLSIDKDSLYGMSPNLLRSSPSRRGRPRRNTPNETQFQSYCIATKALSRPLVPTQDLPEGSFVGVCGHVMHADCKKRYADEVLNKAAHYSRMGMEIPTNEFRCPLCRYLSNLDIVVVPSLASLIPPQALTTQLSTPIDFDIWLQGLSKWYSETATNSQTALPTHSSISLTYCQGPLPPQENVMTLKSLTQLQKDLSRLSGTSDHLDTVGEFRTLRHSLAYTITVWERSLRGSNQTFFSGLPERFAAGLTYIIRSCIVCHCSQPAVSNPDVLSDAASILACLLPIAGVEGAERKEPSIVDVDCFFLFLSIVMLRPGYFVQRGTVEGAFSWTTGLESLSRLPVGDDVEANVLRLTTCALLVQLILSARFEDLMTFKGPMGDANEPSFVESEEALELYQQLRLAAGISESEVPSPRALGRYLRDGMLPYLRSVAFVLHHICFVDIPEELKTSTNAAGLPISADREVVLLMRYLNLPVNLCALLEQSGNTLKQISAWWCLDKRLEDRIQALVAVPLPVPSRIPGLIHLPNDYTDLLVKASQYTCSGSDNSLYPALCLVCGEFSCFQGYCCRQLEGGRNNVYGAQLHTRRCHAGFAVMLYVHECRIAVYSDQARRVTHLDAPYKDSYGETDRELRRGNPLYLDKAAYTRLSDQWLSHSLACSSTGIIKPEMDWE